MAIIGSVTKREDGRFEGELRTLSIRAEIALLPVSDKSSPNQPDFRVMSQGIEIGAGWIRKGQTSGKEYSSSSARIRRASTAVTSVPSIAPKSLVQRFRYSSSDLDFFPANLTGFSQGHRENPCTLQNAKRARRGDQDKGLTLSGHQRPQRCACGRRQQSVRDVTVR